MGGAHIHLNGRCLFSILGHHPYQSTNSSRGNFQNLWLQFLCPKFEIFYSTRPHFFFVGNRHGWFSSIRKYYSLLECMDFKNPAPPTILQNRRLVKTISKTVIWNGAKNWSRLIIILSYTGTTHIFMSNEEMWFAIIE